MKAQSLHKSNASERSAIFTALSDFKFFFHDSFILQSGLHSSELFKGKAAKATNCFVSDFSVFPVTVPEKAIRISAVCLNFDMVGRGFSEQNIHPISSMSTYMG